ncbi:MAG: hypothetical protein COA92_09805 [Sulfurovum sp.]|nr:MAG: hypothetical protein COA92_09805 [Sulfurovum sp.]
MSWKQYQNELIALTALLIMFFAYIYKHNQVSSQVEHSKTVQHSIGELKEVIALKKVWANKKTDKKIDKLQTLIAQSKVKWSKRSKKITASYTALSSNELNQLIAKILNLPIVITSLNIQKTGSSYNVELKCKW